MKISKPLSDAAILTELGARVSHRRLELQLTQASVAEQAGVAKRTVERIEAGASGQMSSIIRILRVLDLVAGIDLMLPEPQPRPMDLLQRKGKQRRRASKPRRTAAPDEPWSWGDDDR